MTPTWQILVGDVRETLRTIPAGTVQCCVTSPPYWGLRDYGVTGQIGQEPTPDAYVDTMVEVFREVRRVLHDSGTVWLNVGDSYCATDKWGGGKSGNTGKHTVTDDGKCPSWAVRERKEAIPGMKPKDLCLIPWRLAIALQADGWWVRSVICWAKKSCMPESVTDRPTNSWEPIFLLAKSATYFYDNEAVRENFADERMGNPGRSVAGSNPDRADGGIANNGHGWANGAERGGRNQRNVWHLGPEPFQGSHFAVFPTEIPRRAILAGTSAKGCCPTCRAPWVRVVEKLTPPDDVFTNCDSDTGGDVLVKRGVNSAGKKRGSGQKYQNWLNDHPPNTVGWAPGCGCDGVDRRIVSSPTGARAGDDPSLETGRAGMNRPRGDNEGQRLITRHEQALYAAQLKASEHRDEMTGEAGDSFAHYIRTDDSGARPVPSPMLEAWIERGWLRRVTIPETTPLPPIPCLTLDPFLGSGTTAQVALELGRSVIGCELSEDYAALARRRIAPVSLCATAVEPVTGTADTAGLPLFEADSSV